MKVALKKSCIVRPAEPTWSGVMPLTEFEQTAVLTHASLIYFYRPRPSTCDDDMFIILTNALSKVLVYFFPLAGRIRRLSGGRMELDCNGGGVRVIEAECEEYMEKLDDFTPSPEFQDLIPLIDYPAFIDDFPLLLVQLTLFRCGGVSLSFTVSNAVVDGRSFGHFLSEWSRLARQEMIHELPVLDRRLLRAGEPPALKLSEIESKDQQQRTSIGYAAYDLPPLIDGEISSEKERKKETTVAMLKISKAQIEILRSAATKTRPQNLVSSPSAPIRTYSPYEVIAAHIWRCTCRARGHTQNQPTELGICVDTRNRVNPKLPDKFFGKALIDVNARSFSGELITNSLGFAADKVREAIDSVTNEYVNSVIDFLKSVEDLSPYQVSYGLRTGEVKFYGNPNNLVTSYLGLPFYGVDFGWGKEFFMAPGPGTHDSDGESIILKGHASEWDAGGDDAGGLVVVIRLQTEYMDDFKKFFNRDIQNYGRVSKL